MSAFSSSSSSSTTPSNTSQSRSIKKQISSTASRTRRHTDSVEIRKTKKNEFIAKRRQIATSSPTPSPPPPPLITSPSSSQSPSIKFTPSSVQLQNHNHTILQKQAQLSKSLFDLILSYCHTPTSTSTLFEIKTILSSPRLKGNFIDELFTVQNSPMPTLLNHLSMILSSHSPMPDESLIITILHILTNIIAATSTPNTLLSCNAILPSIIALFNVHANSNSTDSNARTEIATQIAWVLGNLSGDGPELRDRILNSGALLVLCRILNTYSILYTQKNLASTSAWCISNLVRGSSNPALPFLNGPLPPSLLLACLNSPNDGEDICKLSVEVSWILTFLSAREDEGVVMLCNPIRNTDNNNSKCIPEEFPDLIEISINLLSSYTSILTNTLFYTLHSEALKASIPLIRTLSNISTSNSGAYTENMLCYMNPGSTAPGLQTLLQMLLTIECISLDANDVTILIKEVLYLVSSLLVDAGAEACSSSFATYIIPTLKNLVIKYSSPTYLDKFSIKVSDGSVITAESLTSIWIALAPSPLSLLSIQKKVDNIEKRDDLLQILLNAHQDAPQNQPNLDFLTGLVQHLKAHTESGGGGGGGSITSCVNSSSLYSNLLVPLYIVHTALTRCKRGAQRLLILTFNELELPSILEVICDESLKISSSNSNFRNSGSGSVIDVIEESAELSSKLIDDFFETETDNSIEEDNNEEIMDFGMNVFDVNSNASKAYGFAFGVPPATSTTHAATNAATNAAKFNFTPQQMGVNSGRGVVQEHINARSGSVGAGRGRGRGVSNVPAWMVQK